MLTAKHYPGKYDVPYVNGMNISTARTGVINTSYSISTCFDELTLGYTDLGSRKYMLILYCPVLSIGYGSGNTGYFPTNTKLGGLVMTQVDDPNQQVFSLLDFQITTKGIPLSSIYGNQGQNLAKSSFIWASELDMTLEAPAACEAGSVVYGQICLG